jgi:hypothetical protein
MLSSATSTRFDCLPESVKLNERATTDKIKNVKSRSLTVKDVLVELKAKCVRGKLVDKTGREIHFHRRIGCWGNPPADYEEQLAAEAKELERLRQKFTVVEILCAPSDPATIH